MGLAPYNTHTDASVVVVVIKSVLGVWPSDQNEWTTFISLYYFSDGPSSCFKLNVTKSTWLFLTLNAFQGQNKRAYRYQLKHFHFYSRNIIPIHCESNFTRKYMIRYIIYFIAIFLQTLLWAQSDTQAPVKRCYWKLNALNKSIPSGMQVCKGLYYIL